METKADRALKSILRDFEAGTEEDYQRIDRNAKYSPPRLPSQNDQLLFYVLAKKLNCYYVTREEKLHWGVVFLYKKQPYALELRKAGLRVLGCTTPTES